MWLKLKIDKIKVRGGANCKMRSNILTNLLLIYFSISLHIINCVRNYKISLFQSIQAKHAQLCMGKV